LTTGVQARRNRSRELGSCSVGPSWQRPVVSVGRFVAAPRRPLWQRVRVRRSARLHCRCRCRCRCDRSIEGATTAVALMRAKELPDIEALLYARPSSLAIADAGLFSRAGIPGSHGATLTRSRRQCFLAAGDRASRIFSPSSPDLGAWSASDSNAWWVRLGADSGRVVPCFMSLQASSGRFHS
jgi:hypothetical protein